MQEPSPDVRLAMRDELARHARPIAELPEHHDLRLTRTFLADLTSGALAEEADDQGAARAGILLAQLSAHLDSG